MSLDAKQIAELKERCKYAATHGFHVAHADHYAAMLAEMAGVDAPVVADAAHLVALCGAAEKAMVEGKPVPKPVPVAAPVVVPMAAKSKSKPVVVEKPKPVVVEEVKPVVVEEVKPAEQSEPVAPETSDSTPKS
jgi:hypothetical protein